MNLALMDTIPEQSVALLTVYSGEEFARLVQYPIIVEMWDKVVRIQNGSKKRAWLAAFDEAERKLISHYYNTAFYKWYLHTGTPQHVSIKFATLQLLQRAVHFFATV